MQNELKKNSIRKILVIGGSGFVGKTLIPSLLGDGHEVSLLNRGNRQMQSTTQLSADRQTPPQVQKVADASENFDVVIDTSAYNRQHSEIAWDAFSGKTKHWIHLSSVAVYKETPHRHPNEKDLIGGADVWEEYGIQKSEADEFLLKHATEVPVTILRPPYLYGPSNDNDRETFVWSRALQGRSVVIPGNGQTPIQFLHVEDLVTAVKAAMKNTPIGAAVYNVASDERPTLSEWVTMLSSIACVPNVGVLAGSDASAWRPRQYFPFRDYPCCVQVDIIKNDLGWQATYGIENGFRQTFATYDLESLRVRNLDISIEDKILAKIRLRK